MSDTSHRYRQYAGLALVAIAYVGGIVGWSCAVLRVDESSPTAPDTTRARTVSSEARQPAPRAAPPASPAALRNGAPQAPPPRHSQFTRLLQRLVNKEGNVDYASLHAEADTALAPYLRDLAAARPHEWSEDARLAFWINAYNAYTLKLIVEHYPVASIRDIPGPTPEKTPFQRSVGPVADTVRTLDEIEHGIIRKRFKDPRIHFALVCAAKSCPQLRRTAYTGPRLDSQLDAQARRFLHDEQKNRIPAGNGTIALSRILKWYGSDFGPTPAAVQRALAPYFEGGVQDSLAHGAYEIQYLPYDWSLNAQASAPPTAPSSPEP